MQPICRGGFYQGISHPTDNVCKPALTLGGGCESIYLLAATVTLKTSPYKNLPTTSVNL
jgi:hypothetical protein